MQQFATSKGTRRNIILTTILAVSSPSTSSAKHQEEQKAPPKNDTTIVAKSYDPHDPMFLSGVALPSADKDNIKDSVDIVDATAHSKSHGTSIRNPWGLGWLGDSLLIGVAIALDAMALMYSRGRRLVTGDESTKREEKKLCQKIGILHALAPIPLLLCGALLAHEIISTSYNIVGRGVVAGLYFVCGATMYGFSNNILRESGSTQSKSSGFFGAVENKLERLGIIITAKVPQSWALAAGVSIDAVISSFKFVVSSGWSMLETVTACAIGGVVVYGLISIAQKLGAHSISKSIANCKSSADYGAIESVTKKLTNFTGGGFLAFRYFAWFGFVNSALTLVGASLGEWSLRAIVLATTALQGGLDWKRARQEITIKQRQKAFEVLGL